MPDTRGCAAGLAALGLLALGLAGCGSDTDYANAPRPPAPILISASISARGVIVSPTRFGAGPVTLVITNQTSRARQVTFKSAQGGRGAFSQETGPINPRDTATVKAEVSRGAAVIQVDGGGIHRAQLTVGRRRGSAQNDLLLP